ncbi:DJ-1/PfpI family protein [Ruminiclostridium cellobioparum]|uniref:DJ-1/PfpI family protein n=1 Tax=Ruminiclostridium cellobioparum TaxID=29355 RepID=UPI0028AD087C|nr:DJ-1/PfpI family protein [Ruminiclostridium cellobioparum]
MKRIEINKIKNGVRWTMGKILVFMYNDMADFEVIYATHLLGHELSKEIVPCAYHMEPVKSKGGMVFLPSVTVAGAKVEDYEGFIIPGGWNPVVREEMLELIRGFYNSGKLLAAICAGPRFLAKAGILDKVKYTTSIVEWNEMRRAQFKEEDPFPRGNFVNARVVRDGSVITSKGISFVDFAVEVADYFGQFKDEAEKQAFFNTITGRE